MTALTCPVCGVPTQPSIYGRRALCLPCTEEETGETYEQIRDRVSAARYKGAQRKWRIVS